MDKVKKHQKAIVAVLKKHQSLCEIKDNDVLRDEIIADTQNNHYQLVTVGWQEEKYFFHVLFHLQIINGKIWLQQNNTEWRIADELMMQGIDRQDIVLGFVEPSLRQYSEFAAV